MRVSTRSAAPRAAARVLKLPAPTAVSTMSFISFFSFLAGAVAAFLAAAARTGARAAPRRAEVRAEVTTRAGVMAVEKEVAIVFGWGGGGKCGRAWKSDVDKNRHALVYRKRVTV